MGLPIPNLDDKTFDEIVLEARTLIARYAPDWTDHNLHDPGMTFIDLFAWLAEAQIYRLNRITDAEYLKFLKMVGIRPSPARPAEVEITFRDIKKERRIEEGSAIVTIAGSEKIAFKTVEETSLVSARLEAVKTAIEGRIIDHTRANETEGIHYHPFAKEAPAGACLLLGFSGEMPQKQMQIVFHLYEEDLPKPGRHGEEKARLLPSVDLVWEYFGGGNWKRLTVKKDMTYALNSSGRIIFEEISSMDRMEEKYWIRAKIAGGHYEIVPKIDRILLNTVTAIQIETIENEYLGSGDGMPDQRAVLQKAPVIEGSLSIKIQMEDGLWELWEEVEDFDSSGPNDPHYMFDPIGGEITFGNGLNGKIPPKFSKIMASVYETTMAEKGNIPKGQHFILNRPGMEEIRGVSLNASQGGRAAESVEEAKKRAKKEFRTPYRAVTAEDFEYLALSTPGLRVARAKAIPGYLPEYPCLSLPDTVTVVVVPYTREEAAPVPTVGFLQTILDHLESHRLVTTRVRVTGPEYIGVSIRCKVHIRRRSGPDEVRKRVDAALKRFLNPLAAVGKKGGWPFGRSVYLSELYRVIDGVEGVDFARELIVDADGYRPDGDEIKIPPIALVYSGEHRLEMVESGVQK